MSEKRSIFEEVDADWEISKAWRQNAEITHIEEKEKIES